MRQVVIYPGAECPSLPGCISQGETQEEAIVNIPAQAKHPSSPAL
jgi:predicted RNase H-like HicB family nuclease